MSGGNDLQKIDPAEQTVHQLFQKRLIGAAACFDIILCNAVHTACDKVDKVNTVIACDLLHKMLAVHNAFILHIIKTVHHIVFHK